MMYTDDLENVLATVSAKVLEICLAFERETGLEIAGITLARDELGRIACTTDLILSGSAMQTPKNYDG